MTTGQTYEQTGALETSANQSLDRTTLSGAIEMVPKRARVIRDVAEVALKQERSGLGRTAQETLLALDGVCDEYITDDGNLEHPKRALAAAYEVIKESSHTPQEKADFLLHAGNLFVTLVDEDKGEVLQGQLRKKYLPGVLGFDLCQQMSQEVGQFLKEQSEAPEGFAGELDGLEVEAQDGWLDPEALAEHLPVLASVSPATRYEMIHRLVDLKLVTSTKSGYQFPKKTKDQKYLLSGALELADGWQRVKNSMIEGKDIQSLEDAEAAMEKHNKTRAISEVVLETGKPGFGIAPINSLRIGHQDSLEGLRLVKTYIKYLEGLPEEEKPDVLLVTDLMQGVYKHNQSQKRSALAEGFQDANAQFRIVHELLAELKGTNIPMVIGMSENDHREAKDYAIDAVRELEGLLSDAERKDFVHFAQMYKFTQNAMFQDFRKFALDYIIPLSQKYGRRMRTADEMTEDTGGKISQSEFMHLYEHVKLGHKLKPISGIDPEDIIELGTWNADHSVIYVDDCDLLLRMNDGQENRVKYRHAMGLTAESLLTNHMNNPLNLIRSLAMVASNNSELPTALMTGQQQEATMVTHSGVDIISNPGLTNPADSVDTRAFNRRTTGDTSLRTYTTRGGRAWNPEVVEYSRPAEGVVRYTMFDKDILERSESIPRMAIVTFNDWQDGSPTAHLDFVIYAQALAQRYARRMPVAIHGEGDFNHGGIYPNMYREAQAIGLMDMDSQAEMTNGMIRDTWQPAPYTDKQGVMHVLWLPGNHDEQQRVSFPGNNRRNVDDTIEVWRRALENPDVAPEDSIVKTERVFQGDDGTPVPTWIGRPRYGDISMAVSHFHINSKNYKGGSGGLAAYDPYKRLVGMGGFEDIQIASGAHHHNRMHVKANGVWIDIGDANAAGQSEFENMLGMHHSNMSVKVREIGGGKPMTVTYYTDEALIKEQIKYGPYAQAELADARYFDDPGADPLKYGMYSVDGSPQTAIQKRLWVKSREATQWKNHMSEPLHVERGHQSEVTKRLFRIAAELENRVA